MKRLSVLLVLTIILLNSLYSQERNTKIVASEKSENKFAWKAPVQFVAQSDECRRFKLSICLQLKDLVIEPVEIGIS